MTAATWLGDEDPSVQSITMYGHTFVKGEPVDIGQSPFMGKFRGNAFFSVGKDKADVVESKEPDAVDPDEGTERAAIKAELERRHIQYDGRAKLETLRATLAKAQ